MTKAQKQQAEAKGRRLCIEIVIDALYCSNAYIRMGGNCGGKQRLKKAIQCLSEIRDDIKIDEEI